MPSHRTIADSKTQKSEMAPPLRESLFFKLSFFGKHQNMKLDWWSGESGMFESLIIFRTCEQLCSVQDRPAFRSV